MRLPAILNPRNIMARVAVSPLMTRVHIRLAGKPLLGLSALPEGALKHAAKIIILRLDRLGDAILFSSFLRDVRMQLPQAEIHLVCSPVGFLVYKHCPYVDRIHVFDYGEPVYTALAIRTARQHWQLYKAARTFAREHLAPMRANTLIAPRFEADIYGAAYLAAFSRARYTVSYSEKVTNIRRLRNNGDDKLWSVVVPAAGIEHEVLRNAEFFDRIGILTQQPILECWPTAEEKEAADAVLARCRFKRPVVLAPGASEPRKQWPAERFAFVARALEKSGHDVVLVGSTSEVELCSTIASLAQSPRVKDISGQLNFNGLFCLLLRSSGFVGNDSGPMHLASAAGVPVVVVSCHPRNGDESFHQSPLRFGAWGVPHRTLQPAVASAPCVDCCSADRAHCIEQISAREVSEQILALLADESEGAATATPRGRSQLCTSVSKENVGGASIQVEEGKSH
jgi:heptosyltransferase-2